MPVKPQTRSNSSEIATPPMALEAAAAVARDAGVPTHILGDSIEGHARDVGTMGMDSSSRLAIR